MFNPGLPRRCAGTEGHEERAYVAATRSQSAFRGHGVSKRAERDPESFEERNVEWLMFARVSHAASGENGQESGSRRRRTALVDSNRVRFKAELEPGLPHPTAEVEVLAVEEEALVETAEVFEERPAHEQTGARGPVREP